MQQRVTSIDPYNPYAKASPGTITNFVEQQVAQLNRPRTATVLVVAHAPVHSPSIHRQSEQRRGLHATAQHQTKRRTTQMADLMRTSRRNNLL